MDLVRLWMHECDRVYRDKLIEERDMEYYDRIQQDITKKIFEVYLYMPVLFKTNDCNYYVIARRTVTLFPP